MLRLQKIILTTRIIPPLAKNSLSSRGGGEIIPYWKTKQFFEKKKIGENKNIFFTSMHKIIDPPPLCLKSRDLKFELWGFSYTRKEAQKGCWKVYDCFCYEIIYILSDE